MGRVQKKLCSMCVIVLAGVLLVQINVWAQEGTLPKFQTSPVVNVGVVGHQLDTKSLKNIYLGRQTTWPDKTPIIFVILQEGDVHTQFLKEYVSKTPSQFDNYWKKKVFSGQGTMPKAFKTEKELIDYVGKTKGAIGYIGIKTEVNDKVTKVEIVK